MSSQHLPRERLPTIYITHGGGPCFWMDLPPPFGQGAFDRLRSYLAQLIATLPSRPKAILVISAHWETDHPTVSINPAPPMLFDYYGFPAHTYQLSYPAPGAPELATQIQDLLKSKNIAIETDRIRGFDHGVFVPFLIIDPEARIPVVMMSLQKDLNPAEHIRIGTALELLRDQDVLIVGSGSSYHNLRSYFDGIEAEAAQFDSWLNEAVTSLSEEERNKALINWSEAPFARACHPREEHLIPLMVAAGAAGKSKGRRTFGDIIGGKSISCFGFYDGP